MAAGLLLLQHGVALFDGPHDGQSGGLVASLLGRQGR